jgi:hypothetical protein
LHSDDPQQSGEELYRVDDGRSDVGVGRVHVLYHLPGVYHDVGFPAELSQHREVQRTQVLPVGQLDLLEAMSPLDSCCDLQSHLQISPFDLMSRVEKGYPLLGPVLLLLGDHLHDGVGHELIEQEGLKNGHEGRTQKDKDMLELIDRVLSHISEKKTDQHAKDPTRRVDPSQRRSNRTGKDLLDECPCQGHVQSVEDSQQKSAQEAGEQLRDY